jgi:hypothetical protein
MEATNWLLLGEWSMPSNIMEDIMKEAIDKLECIGLSVVVVMSNQGSNFYSLARRLNCHS